MKSFRGFIKGIILRALNADPIDNTEGSIWHNGSDLKLKTYLDSDVREILTDSQVQNIENKIIDGTDATGTNTISIDASDATYDNVSSGLLATDAQAAIDELDADLDQVALDLNDHIINPTDAHDASAISYDNTLSGLTAVDVQDAVDEVQDNVDAVGLALANHITDITDAHDASAISYDNTLSGLTAIEVQDAIDELNADILAIPASANPNLSNLQAPTAINQNLLPSSDLTRNIGATGNRFSEIFVNEINNDTNPISVNNSQLSDVVDPTLDQDAATKKYVDDAIALGGGLYKVNLHDPVLTTLPATTATLIDGQTVVDGNKVLFTNLAVGNNIIYLAEVVGINITWTEILAFNNSEFASPGDTVIVISGNSFQSQVGIYDGSIWGFNNKVRYFNGEDYLEQSSLYSATLTDNSSGLVFLLDASVFPNIEVTYSLTRNTTKEMGTLKLITHNGNVSIIQNETTIGSDSGVAFSVALNAGDLELNYDTTSSGFNANMKYSYKAWND